MKRRRAQSDRQSFARRRVRYSGAVLAGLTLLIAGCSESSEPDGSGAVDVEAPTTVATCDAPPENGAVLVRDDARGTGPHTVSINNTSAGNTIVNLRDGASNDLVLSFFVARGATASVNDIPDGSYRVQYATGGELGEDCESFAALVGASQDPEIVEFVAGQAMTLTYELTPMEGGNFDGQSIGSEAFSAD